MPQNKPEKYRKKPVTIETIIYDGTNAIKIWDWADKPHHVDGDYGKKYLLIDTLEGTMRAEKGDYIIKGVQGEVYPCKPGIFKQTYERVGDA